MYKLFIADDEPWILEGIKASIDWEKEGFRLSGTAMNGPDAVCVIRDTRPHLALVDIRMPGCNGLEERLDSGHLAVRAAVEAGELVIAVSDNGQGIPPERLQALEEVLRHPDLEAPEQSGVGLSNVARRIHLARGNAFGISIDSAPGEGTTVTIRLPAGEEEKAGV